MLKKDLEIANEKMLHELAEAVETKNEWARKNSVLTNNLNALRKTSTEDNSTIKRMNEDRINCRRAIDSIENTIIGNKGGAPVFDTRGYDNRTSEPIETDYKEVFYELLGFFKASTTEI